MLRAAALDVSADDPDAVIAQWGALHPIGRVGAPAEVADAIVFLASPMSSFVTGADLRVDGGVLAGVALPAPTPPTPRGPKTYGDVNREVPGHRRGRLHRRLGRAAAARRGRAGGGHPT
jgi:hypothetical protein